MEIICPDCKFSREVDETKIPARSKVATCPKCQAKFTFRELPEDVTPVDVTPVDATPVDVAPVDVAQEDVAPEAPVAKTPKPAPPVAPKPPVARENGRTFPNISAPGEDPREELWAKLDTMAPPEETEEEAQDAQSPLQDEQQPVPGWNGQFNGDFPDPMQADSFEEDEEETSILVPPPFEQLDRYGFFHGLYMTIKLVLTSPRLFFSVMPVGGGLAKPLAFTILLTMVQGFVQYFWGMAGLSAAMTGEGAEAMGGISGALAPVMMLLLMPAFIAAGQFIVTGVYHALLILMRADNQGFEGTFRALAYANAPIILGIFPMPINEIEVAWMGIAAIWGLFLTIMGLRYIHKVSFAKVIPVALIPLLLGLIGAMLIYQTQLPTI